MARRNLVARGFSMALIALLAAACDFSALSGAAAGARGGLGGGVGSGQAGGPRTVAGPAIAIADRWEEAGDPNEPVAGSPWVGAATFEPTSDDADGWARHIAYSPDGETLYVAFEDAGLIAWDVDGNKPRWSKPIDATRGIAVSRDGARIAAWGITDGSRSDDDPAYGTSKPLRVLAAASGEVEVEYTAPRSGRLICEDYGLKPFRAEFGDDGELYAVMISTLNAAQPGSPKVSPIDEDDDDAGKCRPHKETTLVRYEGRKPTPVWQWNYAIPPCDGSLPNWCSVPLPSMAINHAGPNLAVAGCDGSVAYLDRRSGRELGRTQCPNGQDKQIYEQIETLNPEVGALTFSADGDRLLVGHRAHAHLMVYEGASRSTPGKMSYKAHVQGSGVSEMPLSPDGGLLAFVQETFQVYDVAAGKLVHTGRVYGGGFAFNPAKREMASLDGGSGVVTLHHMGGKPAADGTQVAATRRGLAGW